jgi:hypothetical protein
MAKRGVVAGVTAVLAAIAVAVVVVVVGSGGDHTTPAGAEATVHTAAVRRGTLTASTSQAGVLSYRSRPDGSPYAVVNQATGIYTALPAVGQVVTQGQVLYRVNDVPVVLLTGSTPVYRSMSLGMTGPDVAQVNADLVALGYATADQIGLAPTAYGWGTVLAVQKLQAATGVTPTGTLALGQAVFQPNALRVTTLSAQLGGSAQSGQPAMAGTSTERRVLVALDASQQATVAVSDTVTITLPDGHTTPGVVSSVGSVATCPTEARSGTGSDPTSATDDCSSAAGSASAPTVAVEITPSDPPATGTWDQAPVRIGITTAQVPDALSVPVTALLARAGGGYRVEVIGPGPTHRLVPVSLGLFDDGDGLVQVTGSGLAAGQHVVVPAT